MKKKLFPSLFLTLFLILSQSANAMGYTPITNGYTDSGVYYEVYEIETTTLSNNTYAITSSIAVSRQLQFQGIIVPPRTMDYVEVIHGITYRGIITLSRFTYEDNNTIALYTGLLTEVN